MCFKNLPIEFDATGKARLRDGVADPYSVTVAEPKGETLPLTGSDVAEMALLGAGSVLVGVVVVRRGRRGTAPA